MEIWKNIQNYEGFYQVSNLGNVKSLSRIKQNNGGVYQTKERILKPSKNKGYPQVVLEKDGKRVTKKIHRLVSESFLDNPNNYPQINHKNKNRADNRVINLEWCTSQQNAEHAFAKTILLVDPDGNKIQITNISKFCIEHGLQAGNLTKVIQGKRTHTGGYHVCN